MALGTGVVPALAEFGEAVQFTGDDVPQREDLRVGADSGHPGAGGGDERLTQVVRVGEVGDGVGEGAAERRVERVLDDPDEQGFLAAEVVVDRHLGHARLGGDEIDTHVEALTQKEPAGRVEDGQSLCLGARSGGGRLTSFVLMCRV